MPNADKQRFLNAMVLKFQIETIREIGYTPWVSYCPALACRSILGLPDSMVGAVTKLSVSVDQFNKNARSRFKDAGAAQFRYVDKIHGCKSLNLSLYACKYVQVDTASGYLYLDARFAGVAYPNIAIPVECITNVFARDNDDLDFFELGWPTFGGGKLIHADEKGVMTETTFGEKFLESLDDAPTVSHEPVQGSLLTDSHPEGGTNEGSKVVSLDTFRSKSRSRS